MPGLRKHEDWGDLTKAGDPGTGYDADEPQDSVLSKRSQSQKDGYRVIPRRWGVQSGQLHRDREQTVGARGWGRDIGG